MLRKRESKIRKERKKEKKTVHDEIRNTTQSLVELICSLLAAGRGGIRRDQQLTTCSHFLIESFHPTPEALVGIAGKTKKKKGNKN